MTPAQVFNSRDLLAISGGADNVWTAYFAIGEVARFSNWQPVGGGGRNASTIAPTSRSSKRILQPSPAHPQQSQSHAHVVGGSLDLARHAAKVAAFAASRTRTPRPDARRPVTERA
jgi:hypothetical protein